MKKTVLFYALAAASISIPSIANAELALYAEIFPAIISSDADGDRETDFEDQGSLVGVELEKDIGNDMAAFGTFEIEYDAEEDELALAAAFAGISGGFGAFVLGNTDTPSSDIVPKADIFDIFGNAFGQDLGGQDLAAYQFAIGENISGAVSYLFDALEAEAVEEGEEAGEDADGLDFAVDFGFGPVTLGLGYSAFDDDDDTDLLGVGVEVGIGESAIIAAHYEDHSADGASYHLAGQWAVGSNAFRLGYGENDETNEDATTLGFAHEFAEDVSATLEYETTDEADAIAFGLIIAL